MKREAARLALVTAVHYSYNPHTTHLVPPPGRLLLFPVSCAAIPRLLRPGPPLTLCPSPCVTPLTGTQLLSCSLT